MLSVITNGERAERLLPIYLTTAGTDYSEIHVNRPNGAPFHHIYVVEKGAVRFQTPKGAFLLDAGSALFVRKGYPTVYGPTGADCRAGWVTFDGVACDALLEYYRAEDFVFFKSEEVISFVHACCKEVERGGSPEALSRHVYGILEGFFGRLRAQTAPSALRTAKAYIEAHFREEFSVASVAAAAGISPSLLFRHFHNEEGSTPTDYLRRVRIGRAKQLLLECPLLRIREVAAACGYADFAYFCKVFRAEVGMTPKTYRDRYLL